MSSWLVGTEVMKSCQVSSRSGATWDFVPIAKLFIHGCTFAEYDLCRQLQPRLSVSILFQYRDMRHSVPSSKKGLHIILYRKDNLRRVLL
jgi:hypothetical protein